MVAAVRNDRDQVRRIGFVGFVVVGIGLGIIVSLGWLVMSATPREAARDEATALVPSGADVTPLGEFDPPPWYGGVYELRQEFSGGAADRVDLRSVVLGHLEQQGWHVTVVDERPGATVIDATRRDLVTRYQVYGPPSTPDVRGVILVRYDRPDPVAIVLLGGLLGGGVGAALAVLTSRKRRHAQ